MSHSARANLRPGTLALLLAFKARRDELPDAFSRSLLVLGRKTFRSLYPRGVRAKAISRYAIGVH